MSEDEFELEGLSMLKSYRDCYGNADNNISFNDKRLGIFATNCSRGKTRVKVIIVMMILYSSGMKILKIRRLLTTLIRWEVNPSGWNSNLTFSIHL